MTAVPVSDATLVCDSRCVLGEGLTWHAGHAAWFWLDIEGREIWSWRPGDDATCRWSLPDRAGAFAFTASGRLLVGLTKSLVLTSIDDARDGGALEVEHLVDVDLAVPTTRVNDGRPDRAGHFVFGTMNEAADEAPIGSIYQYSARHGLRRLPVDGVAIANSICFSPDGETIYYADSLRRAIMRGRYDSERASVSHIEPFVASTGNVLPDGSIVDAAGGLWNAEWGGSAVRRYDQEGRVTHLVRVATPHVTCPAFGGPSLSDLVVTTARWMMSPEAVAKTPTAGGLFRATGLGVSGLPELPVAGL